MSDKSGSGTRWKRIDYLMRKPKTSEPAAQVARRFKQYDTDRQCWVADGAYTALVTESPRNGFKEFFIMSKLTGRIMRRVKSEQTHRVMWALLALLEFDNFLALDQTAIARDLSMPVSNVNRAIKSLIKIGAVVVGSPTGVHKSYKLSPVWVWRGKAKDHIKALDEHRMGEALGGGEAAREASEAMRDWNA